MKILSLSLVGNERLKYSGTREIHFTPQSTIQLLIGDNGSGKSTVLNELSPLPALKNDYSKGGYKEIVISHRGYYYKLRSEFNKDQQHSFIRAESLEGLEQGVNLNEGHTLTVQKQLVDTHFRYNAEIHDLLLGNIKLTLLSPQKRKEWMVKLCTVDVTYAVEVYQRLLTNARNVLGARKHTEQKLLEEKGRLLSEAEIAALKNQIAELSKLSRAYSEAKTPLRGEPRQELESLERGLSTLLTRVDSVSNELVALCSIDLRPAKTYSEYREIAEDAKTKVGTYEERVESLKREYESIDQLVALLSNEGGKSLSELVAERDSLVETLRTVDLSDELLERHDLRAVLNDVTRISDVLDDLLLVLPKNIGMQKFNKQTVAEHETLLKDAQLKIDKLKYGIDTRERRKDELEKHRPTECPNCNHVWVPGMSENELIHLAEQITALQSRLPEAESSKQTLVEFLTAAHQWKEVYSHYTNYVRDYPRLDFIWSYFSQSGKLMDNPASLVGYLRSLLPRLNTAISTQALKERLDVLSSAINQREQVEGEKGKVLTRRAEYLETTLSETLAKLTDAKGEYRKLKSTLEQLDTIAEKKELLNKLLEDVSDALIKKDQYTKNALLDQEIDETLLTLAGLSKQFNEALGKTQVVEHLESTLAELRVSELDYRYLLQSLSPTDGLIADSLMGFVRALTDQMNYVIKQIWTNRLSVLPCHAEKGDLDYKFPLQFEAGKSVPDVSLGSKGQKELVDYVFVLIAMIYLDLKDYPLLMDEVGHSFHDKHRIKLFDYIKRLLDQGIVGQIFVVSHFSNTHGTLTHADVNVIDNTGVLVPPNANRYFTIT